MALISNINWVTGEITVSRNDMTLIQASPEIRGLDTTAFFDELKAAEASVEGMPWPDTQRHNLPYTISGITYAESIEIIPPYFVTFEDGQYRVILSGSNNNIIDVATNNQVGILGNNSAGLVDQTLYTPISDAEKDDIVLRIFQRVMEGSETFEQAMRLIRAEAAGDIVVSGLEHRIKGADGVTDRIVANADETGRDVTSTDGT